MDYKLKSAMKKLAIGVDIGGINTAFGLVDENGDLYAESVISTKKYPFVDDYPAYIQDLCDSMRALASSLSFEYELAGIGIGAPNANFHKEPSKRPPTSGSSAPVSRIPTSRAASSRLRPISPAVSTA